MKHVTQRRNSYYYERHYPTRVVGKAPSKRFSMPLGIKVGASESEIAKAAAVAGEAFEVEVRRLENTDAQVASDEALEMLATKAMRSLGFDDLDLSTIKLSGSSPSEHEMTAEQVVEHFIEVALAQAMDSLPEDDETQRAVKKRVADRLTKRSSQTPKRLSQLWKPYCDYRDVQADDSKRYRQKLSNFNRALSFIGDHPLVPSTDKEINRGHKELVESLIARGVKPVSAQKAITMSLGCFRWASDEFEMDWNIRTIRPKASDKAKSTQRKTASKQQMIEVAQACVAADDVVGTMGILALHGLLPTEIARIENVDTLNSKIPHILLPEGKTVQRKRAVVICFGLKTLKRHLSDAIQYSASKTDNEGGSATLNKRLRKMYPGDDRISWYSTRHGARNLWVMSNANTALMNAFLGWAGAEGGGMHLHYGAEGIDQSDFLKALKAAGYKAYKPIRDALT
jgi:translation elongation factor EF-1beta